MKRFSIIIILTFISIFCLGQKYEPGILIGKKYFQVEKILYLQKDYRLIDKSPLSLTYINWRSGFYVQYIFIKCKHSRRCFVSSVVLNVKDADSLIQSHLTLGDWIDYNSYYLYYTSTYIKPLKVVVTNVGYMRRFDYLYFYDEEKEDWE